MDNTNNSTKPRLGFNEKIQTITLKVIKYKDWALNNSKWLFALCVLFVIGMIVGCIITYDKDHDMSDAKIMSAIMLKKTQGTAMMYDQALSEQFKMFNTKLDKFKEEHRNAINKDLMEYKMTMMQIVYQFSLNADFSKSICKKYENMDTISKEVAMNDIRQIKYLDDFGSLLEKTFMASVLMVQAHLMQKEIELLMISNSSEKFIKYSNACKEEIVKLENDYQTYMTFSKSNEFKEIAKSIRYYKTTPIDISLFSLSSKIYADSDKWYQQLTSTFGRAYLNFQQLILD